MPSKNKSCFDILIKDLIYNNENKKEIVMKVWWYTTVQDVKRNLIQNTATNSTTTATPASTTVDGFSSTINSINNVYLFTTTSRRPLSNRASMSDLGALDGSTLFMWNGQLPRQSSFIAVRGSGTGISGCEDSLIDLINSVKGGLEFDFQPKSLRAGDGIEGTGGVYFMKDSKGQNTAVFKPSDEEQGMENNPMKNSDACQRKDFTPGMGCCREAAAFAMDVNNIAGIPATEEVILSNSCFSFNSKRRGDRKEAKVTPKVGSLQKFVHSVGFFEDYGKGVFSDFEVQKIALLDMRILNNDRHGGNLLVRKRALSDRRQQWSRSNSFDSTGTDSSSSTAASVSSPASPFSARKFMKRSSSMSSQSSLSEEETTFSSFGCIEEKEGGEGEGQVGDNRSFDYELVPIDHGFCFPPKLHIHADNWVWLSYPQVKRPVCAELIEYMNSIDIDALLTALRDQYRGRIEEEAFFLLRLIHNIILDCLNRGLTLHQIAEVIIRKDDFDVVDYDESDTSKSSQLEEIIEYADFNAVRALKNSHININHGAEIISSKAKGKLDFSATMPPLSTNFNFDFNSAHIGNIIRKQRSLDDSLLSADTSSFPSSYSFSKLSSLSLSLSTSMPVSSGNSKRSNEPRMLIAPSSDPSSQLTLSDIGFTDVTSDDCLSYSGSPTGLVLSPLQLAASSGSSSSKTIRDYDRNYFDVDVNDVDDGINLNNRLQLQLKPVQDVDVILCSSYDSDKIIIFCDEHDDDYLIGEADDEEEQNEEEVYQSDKQLKKGKDTLLGQTKPRIIINNNNNHHHSHNNSSSSNDDDSQGSVHTIPNSGRAVLGGSGGSGLARSVSFAAFASNKLYSPSVAKKSLLSEKALVDSQSEYLRLRNDFVTGACSRLISKTTTGH